MVFISPPVFDSSLLDLVRTDARNFCRSSDVLSPTRPCPGRSCRTCPAPVRRPVKPNQRDHSQCSVGETWFCSLKSVKLLPWDPLKPILVWFLSGRSCPHPAGQARVRHGHGRHGWIERRSKGRRLLRRPAVRDSDRVDGKWSTYEIPTTSTLQQVSSGGFWRW